MGIYSIINLGKNEIKVEEVEMNQAELLFFKDNPRVFTQVHLSEDDDPSQETLEDKMCNLESVKKLRTSIEANNGLIHPIFVCNNVVLEGNSRLAAYRILARNNPEKWAKIKCYKLPDDFSDDMIDTLLGTCHLVGQTPWSAFEKGCYIYRTVKKSRKNVESLANEMGISVCEAKLSYEVYRTMEEANDIVPTKWSYYYELLKTNTLMKADREHPEMNIKATIIEKIKNDEIDEAKDIRKISTIVKSKNEEAMQLLTDFLEGDLELSEAVERAEVVNKAQHIRNNFSKFRKFLQDSVAEIQEQTNIDSDLNMEIKQIENTLKTLIQIR